MPISDPLRIYYLVVLASDDPEAITPFQGFSTSWQPQHWALHRLNTLPADILEPSQPQNDIIAQRMGGLRSLTWAPLNASTLSGAKAEDLGVSLVLFTGEPESADTVAAWAKQQAKPILHISTFDVEGAVNAQKFDLDVLRAYCISAVDANAARIPEKHFKAGKAALAGWKTPVLTASGLKADGHNVLIPNYMTISRAYQTLEIGEAFMGGSEKEYAEAILASVNAVHKIRENIGIKPLHYLSLLRPDLILAEPALYRSHYKRIHAKGLFKEKAVAKTLRLLQTQRGLLNNTDSDFLQEFQDSPSAQQLMGTRQSELDTFTLAVGLHAAQTTAAVMRLSPAVNHIFASLAIYAKSDRSHSVQSRMKKRRLFDAIQKDLADALGQERVEYIKQNEGPFKIISDAPIEWLPIDGLPLSMRHDCSRINATPGNLMMSTLIEPMTMTFSPKDLQRVLVVSAFDDKDPLKNVMRGSIGAVTGIKGKVEIIFKTASTSQEFVDVLNAFDGHIMIFDGHGADNSEEPIGKLAIGKERVNVWELYRKVRVPSIVILSACDTHGIDASTHATVGNGFLFLGARTVVATMLPVGGNESASFVARLLYRLADFLPAALNAHKRVLDWREVISGMLRMTLASEILDELIGPPAALESPRGQIQRQANIDINARETPLWYEALIDNIAKVRGVDPAIIANKAASVVARSDSIRYVQFGNPEAILIDDGRIRKLVLEEYGQAAEG